MDRHVNKYVLGPDAINRFLEYTQTSFDILEINGLRQFAYASYYFDSEQLHTFKEHNQGRRRRFKVRHRCYIDTDKHYFEIKLKGFRNITNKVRIDTKPENILTAGELSTEMQSFCQKVLLEYGYPDWPHKYLPSIGVHYQRMTLSSKNTNERITIDNGIAFSSSDSTTPHHLNDKRWVVEIKSATGRTAADLWLLKNKHRAVSKCSKYGMGITLLKNINSRFRPVMKKEFGYGDLG